MTTLVNFAPAANTLFQFTATLDGQQYTVIITWSLAGQRWYINVLTLNGDLVVSRAMVGSPLGFDINLVGGYFASVLVYRAPTRQFEISP